MLANRAVQYVQETAKRGMVFRPALSLPFRETIAKHEPLPRICITAVSDASHGGEDEWLDDWQEREPLRSQDAKLILIADVSIIDQDEAPVQLSSFASTVQKRAASPTMNTESYQLADIVEAADLLRAAIADAHGQSTIAIGNRVRQAGAFLRGARIAAVARTLFASW